MEMKLHVWLLRGKVDHRLAHVGSQNRIESLGVIAVRLKSQFTLFVVHKPAVGGNRNTADVITDSHLIESFEAAIAKRQVECLSGPVLVTRLSRIRIPIVNVHPVTFL